MVLRPSQLLILRHIFIFRLSRWFPSRTGALLVTYVCSFLYVLIKNFILVVAVFVVFREEIVLCFIFRLLELPQLFAYLLVGQSIRVSLLCRCWSFLGRSAFGPIPFAFKNNSLEGMV